MKSFSKRALLAALMTAAVAPVARAQVTFSIDELAGVSSISPLIYGINGTQATGQNLTFERDGGNRWTAYNYTNNLSNAGSDYNYESDNYLGGGNTPGGAVLPLLQNAQANGAGALITIPINGLVSKVATGTLVPPLTAAQTAADFTPEYPTQAQDPAPNSSHVYENGFVQIAENAFKSNPNQPLAFDLDNEPDLWDSTHAEVHPQPTTYAELLSDSVAYATMIKQVDPNALVYGPVSYGWEGYTTLQNAPDSAADGDFLTWYLKNMAAASKTAGVRLLDALDLHWYPEATGINASGVATRIINDDNSSGVVAARLQAPRSLWDPTYTEASWITEDTGSGPINLINREMGKINANYPGTKLSFSEYNYGAGDNISGGVAEADVLGIFGKYGVYSANEWPLLSSEPFIDGAFALYRNYDGKDSTFGNTEVQAVNSDTVDTSVYASVDSNNPGHLTLMVINKEMTSVTAALSLAGAGNYNMAAVYQLTSANATPQFAGDISLTNPTSFNYTMPAESASLISLTAVASQWNLSSGGDWNTSGNWINGLPNGASTEAEFLNAAGQTVTTSAAITVGSMVFNSPNTYLLSGSGSLTLQTAFGNSTVSVQAGAQKINLPLTIASSTQLNVSSGASLTLGGPVTVNAGLSLTPTGSGMVNYQSSITLQSGASLALGNSTAITGLTLGSGAKLDVTNSTLQINYGSAADPAATIRSLLVSGFNGGNWQGTGITSSTAAGDAGRFTLGYADGGNAADHADTGVPAGDVEVEYTVAGDVNLSGGVDLSDLVIVASDFGQTGSDWAAGDVNYDGNVDLSDLVIVASNFGASLSSVSSANFSGSFAAEWQLALAEVHGADVSVPEPGTAIALIACAAMARRRTSLKRGR
jgi:Glycoside hydrolase family 44